MRVSQRSLIPQRDGKTSQQEGKWGNEEMEMEMETIANRKDKRKSGIREWAEKVSWDRHNWLHLCWIYSTRFHPFFAELRLEISDFIFFTSSFTAHSILFSHVKCSSVKWRWRVCILYKKLLADDFILLAVLTMVQRSKIQTFIFNYLHVRVRAYSNCEHFYSNEIK